MGDAFIRRASVDDASALLAIESASFNSDRISSRQMCYLLTKAKAVTFVYEQDKLVIGYAMVLLPMLPKPARLYSIAIAENFRGRNLATDLMTGILRYVREQKFSEIRLEVRISQHNALALYRRCGFVIMRQLPGYYDDGEDAFRMQYIL